ncbi:HAD family hydrolase [Aureivirga sp. CE67]|uniref:HAD family hydrolase n=1 Tax=Aureivirga sp. CE67 TaxID=1788983 RepID=UPI0018CA2DC4|nr:HAD family phosphatase [Aureivirga sp. CE67]
MIDTVIFDLGGVLLNWNPRNLYEKVFEGNEEKINWFLNEICTSEWNSIQDSGLRTMKEATELKVAEFPEHEELIRMYYDHWEEMFDGSIPGSVKVLEELKENTKQRLFALTNWNVENFDYAENTFPFLKNFEDILVSGQEKTMKPDPKIFKIAIERFGIEAEKTVFIDDKLENVKAFEKFGVKGIHFKSPEQLRESLKELNIL